MSERVCLVLDVWDPKRGGLEAYAADLCRALVEDGRRVTIVCGRAATRPTGAEVVTTGSGGPAFYLDADRATDGARLGRVLAFRHPGISCDVFLPLGGLLASSLAARRHAEPFWLRGPRALARRVSRRTQCFLRRERAFFERGSGEVLASSELVRDEIARRFPGYRERVVVTGLPVDEKRFALRPMRERVRLRRESVGVRDEPLVLWVGNDVRRKGLSTAIAVLRRQRLRKLDTRLVLVGHGTTRYDGREAGLVGLGFVERIEDLYVAADVVLAPSLEDNLSFSVIEALASGTPVVTTRRNGASMYVQDHDIGRVVDQAGDVHELDGATLAMLARDNLDEGVRRRRRDAVGSCFRARHFEGLLQRI